MKTDIYRFERNVNELDGIENIVKRAAAYGGLDKKQQLRLSLLSEELAEMLPNLLLCGKGEFWIENRGSSYEIHARVEADDLLSKEERNELLSVSKSGKNAAAVGIMNKIRIAAETMFASYALSVGTAGKVEGDTDDDFYDMGLDDELWSLKNYKNNVKTNTVAWDELEKSIIANLADDVTVSIIKNTVEIVIKKIF